MLPFLRRADNRPGMPSYDAHDLVSEIGQEWPDLDNVELEDELGDEPPDAA
jgi:hypothetical protein